MDSIIIFCAKYLVYIALLLSAAYLLTLPKRDRIRAVVFFVIAGLVAFVLAKIGGAIFYNARPFVVNHITPLIAHDANNGFPSDHTLITAVVAVTLYVISKKSGIALFVAAIIIGSSRVLAHVHHPIDVIGSFAFAIIGGLAAYYLTPRVMRYVQK
jgi:undecaprenyl-diphosphatase